MIEAREREREREREIDGCLSVYYCSYKQNTLNCCSILNKFWFKVGGIHK